MALRSVIWPSGVTITTGIPRRDAHVEGVAGARGAAARNRRERDHQHRLRVEHLNVSPGGRRGGRSASSTRGAPRPASRARGRPRQRCDRPHARRHARSARPWARSTRFHVMCTTTEFNLLFTYTTSLSATTTTTVAAQATFQYGVEFPVVRPARGALSALSREVGVATEMSCEGRACVGRRGVRSRVTPEPVVTARRLL